MCAEGTLQVTEDAASYIKSSFWSIKMGSIFGFIDYCVGYAFYRATEVKIKQVKENRMRELCWRHLDGVQSMIKRKQPKMNPEDKKKDKKSQCWHAHLQVLQ